MNDEGHQRLSLAALQKWSDLGYGMFIHYNMNTYEITDKVTHPIGNTPPSGFNPDRLDVGQWVSVARDADMKYAVLTAKHITGFCLWPSNYTDYHIGNSPVRLDIVEQFVTECDAKGLAAGLYYASWDNHHLFGSQTPTLHSWASAFTTPEYLEFQTNQIMELLARYPGLDILWIDIPTVLPRGYRHALYGEIAERRPDLYIVMNNGGGDGTLAVARTWPTDILTMECTFPRSDRGYMPWHEIEGKRYYVPAEICEKISLRSWFHWDNDRPRTERELLGIYLLARERGANFLLNVPPDGHGVIPRQYVDALTALARSLERVAE